MSFWQYIEQMGAAKASLQNIAVEDYHKNLHARTRRLHSRKNKIPEIAQPQITTYLFKIAVS